MLPQKDYRLKTVVPFAVLTSFPITATKNWSWLRFCGEPFPPICVAHVLLAKNTLIVCLQSKFVLRIAELLSKANVVKKSKQPQHKR